MKALRNFRLGTGSRAVQKRILLYLGTGSRRKSVAMIASDLPVGAPRFRYMNWGVVWGDGGPMGSSMGGVGPNSRRVGVVGPKVLLLRFPPW